MLLDVVDIVRGWSTKVCWVFLYDDEQEVGRGMPVARALYVKNDVASADRPLGIVGQNITETVDVDAGKVTIAL
jgi:hypothetical protein